MLDNRRIRVDWDQGFEEGRQYGRGNTGAQKRDELNYKDDPDRPMGNNSLI
jgi:nuclear cap-binding protein subunit 2